MPPIRYAQWEQSESRCVSALLKVDRLNALQLRRCSKCHMDSSGSTMSVATTLANIFQSQKTNFMTVAKFVSGSNHTHRRAQYLLNKKWHGTKKLSNLFSVQIIHLKQIDFGYALISSVMDFKKIWGINTTAPPANQKTRCFGRLSQTRSGHSSCHITNKLHSRFDLF